MKLLLTLFITLLAISCTSSNITEGEKPDSEPISCVVESSHFAYEVTNDSGALSFQKIGDTLIITDYWTMVQQPSAMETRIDTSGDTLIVEYSPGEGIGIVLDWTPSVCVTSKIVFESGIEGLHYVKFPANKNARVPRNDEVGFRNALVDTVGRIQ